jgi:nucleotide-binding universal stress UspA family protein
MFGKILLATDLSPAWDEIVACAGELKVLGCREVVLVHVITVKFLGGFGEQIQAEAEPKLAAQADRLAACGFTVCREMPRGLPAYAISEAAQRHCADLIIVGPLKPSRWQERILGSVAAAVLHRVEVPVLLLKTGIKEDMAPGACRLRATELLRHVLFPTDFSETSERAGSSLERLADRGIAQATVLHALDVPGGEAYPPGFQEMAVARALASLTVWEERLRRAGIPRIETIFDPGRPLPAILRTLASQDVSLVVMGTQGKGFVKEIFLGSVAHNVSRLAPCPVLLAPSATR